VPVAGELVKGALGGAMLGIGAMLALGCNIGGFFSAVSALSLSGFGMMVGLFVGAIVGLRYLVWELAHRPAWSAGRSSVFLAARGGTATQPVVGALVIALVGFAEPAAIGRTFAARDRVAWSADREFVSQGAANVAAGLTGGLPVGGSLGRSTLNRQAGARSGWSGAVTGAIVLVLLPVSSVISPLPAAVLAAIVLVTVLPMVNLAAIARLWPTSRPATLIAVGTFAATLAFAPRIERGVIAGVGLSVAVHLWRELRIDAESWLDGETLNLRPQGVLWFGAVERLEDVLVEELSRHREASRLLLHLDSVGRLDITAALVLRDLLAQARASGMEVELAGVQERDERVVESVLLAEPRRPGRRRPRAPDELNTKPDT
jgi:SulP family sulfate permease